jgi:hypothetical protein
MIGKKVKVFWPVDERWYTGTVQEFNASTGEHRLQYPDGDTEWVKIGDIMASQNAGSDSLDPLPPISPTREQEAKATEGGVEGDRSWHEAGPYGYSSGYHPQGGGGFPPYSGGPPHHPMNHYMMYPPYGGGPAYPPPQHFGGMPPPVSSSAPSPTAEAKEREGGKKPDASPRRKTGPKPWSKEEDALLLNLVHTMQWPMKWTVVAQSLQDRTGKQCRERYVNHLNPRLKTTDWNPVEDATIFHLYNTIGSHWAKMSKIIPGRTDNGIKNRFHNIRRQYEREDAHRLRLSAVEDFPEEIRLDRLRKFPEHLSGKSINLWDMKSAVGVLAAQTVLSGNINRTNSRFGPFRKAGAGESCVRCGLLLPSIHTGTEICTKTGWCQSCTRVPPNVSGNLLRECLNLRREDDKELRKVIESWEEYFVPDAENTWPYSKSAEENEGDEEEQVPVKSEG